MKYLDMAVAEADAEARRLTVPLTGVLAKLVKRVLEDAANVVDEARGEGYVDLRTLVTRISDLADRDVPGTGSGS